MWIQSHGCSSHSKGAMAQREEMNDSTDIDCISSLELQYQHQHVATRHTLQLKGNFIPARMLQVKNSRWRLHHVLNIWTGTHYVHARVRQIVGRVHPRTLHSFWMKLNININNIYMINFEHCLCLFQSIIESPIAGYYWKAAHNLLFGVKNGFGVENGSFISNWTSS